MIAVVMREKAAPPAARQPVLVWWDQAWLGSPASFSAMRALG
jgi:hypothetical protein